MATEMTKVALPAESGEGATTVSAKARKKKRRAKKGGMTKARAVQLCVDALGPDAPTAAVQEEVKKRYKFDLKTTNVSQYKSVYLKSLREGAPRASDLPEPTAVNRGGRPPKAKAVAGGDPTLEEIRSVKAVYGRIGEKRFGEMMDLIAGR